LPQFFFTLNQEVVISLQIQELSAEDVERQINKFTDFLYQHLGPYRDEKQAIYKSFQYYLKESGGGNVFTATNEESELLGVCVVLNTNMAHFLPEKFLIYIAVSSEARGRGLGTKLIQFVQDKLGSDICLHVEKNNPAKKLYERCGFTNKYEEMRFHPNG
jgi:ribosomal protein S18 acetylase RimI-like enzyme